MADDTGHKSAAVWCDLRLPGRAHATIKAWGARLGMSAEGMARMLLLMRVHEMLGEGDAEQKSEAAGDGKEQSLRLWTEKLQSIGMRSDALPPPFKAEDGFRLYAKGQFAWGPGLCPQHEFATVDPDDHVEVFSSPDG